MPITAAIAPGNANPVPPTPAGTHKRGFATHASAITPGNAGGAKCKG
jgi:hypothetical protein